MNMSLRHVRELRAALEKKSWEQPFDDKKYMCCKRAKNQLH